MFAPPALHSVRVRFSHDNPFTQAKCPDRILPWAGTACSVYTRAGVSIFLSQCFRCSHRVRMFPAQTAGMKQQRCQIQGYGRNNTPISNSPARAKAPLAPLARAETHGRYCSFHPFNPKRRLVSVLLDRNIRTLRSDNLLVARKIWLKGIWLCSLIYHK